MRHGLEVLPGAPGHPLRIAAVVSRITTSYLARSDSGLVLS
jgi:hypothetical protein